MQHFGPAAQGRGIQLRFPVLSADTVCERVLYRKLSRGVLSMSRSIPLFIYKGYIAPPRHYSGTKRGGLWEALLHKFLVCSVFIFTVYT